MRRSIIALSVIFVACAEQPTALSPDPEPGPDFPRDGIPGPLPSIVPPGHIGPPPRARTSIPAGPPTLSPTFLSDIVAVGAGNSFSCALRSDGAAFCWGANAHGRLGDGTTTPSAAPVPVSGNHTFAQLIVGDMNACGITAGGSTHCWGGNSQGQLGAGLPTSQFSSVPVPVSGGHNFNNLSVGLRTICGVAADGVTYCWGSNRNGQLGNGTMGGLSNVPVAVSNSASLGFVTVSHGFLSTCALDEAGAAFCWGVDNGEFGNGSMTVPFSLTPTSAASGMTLATIESGILYTCGLNGGGGALCWGLSNLAGQQGIGSFAEPVVSPTAVVGGLNFASLDTQNNNSILGATCGITTSNNQAWCWGSNQKGQLGAPSAETCNLTDIDDFDCSSVPIEVSGDHQFTSIAVGREHMCARALDGGVLCWGDNQFGQLGDGTVVNSPVPVAVQGPMARVDSDGDGTPDPFDDCPNEFGPPDNNGCPRTEVPEGTPIPNGPSSCEIEVDGKFGTTIEGSTVCVEWADITPVVSLGGESIVYQALDEVDGEFLYLMYDWIGSGTPLQPGDASGQVRFFVGSDVFDVTFVQGDANSTGGLNDDVRVLRNGLPFDNNSDEGPPIVGAVDRNNTSPNFADSHNLFELKVRLLKTAETPGGLPSEEGGLYSPDPAFWGAALPGSPLTQVSSIVLDIGEGGVVTATTTAIQALEVDVDIKPGSDPNSINCTNHKESIAVAILTTDDFDATTVDHTTVTFEGATETHVNKKTGVARRHEEDVDGDGDTDLVLHFRLGDTGLTCDSTEGSLEGETFDGQGIEGTDAVRMID